MRSAASTRSVRRLNARARAEDGFTLLEILVVIVIIGLLIGLVAPAVLRQLGGARISVTKQSIARLGSVLDLYKLDVGSYPTSDQGLAALVQKPGDVDSWNGPYLQGGKLPLDPWNHPYLYQNPSVREGLPYDLCSHGPDNVQGAPGQAGMICNE
ncbi:MAG TPA: type II secretion system major pseudopilin GspG [Acetobacteraceae bacterium]|jgi:general secretion pathway protein G|nr:type II secretion system major pseudopilin GspG [Acetobacteraceae bacterium]